MSKNKNTRAVTYVPLIFTNKGDIDDKYINDKNTGNYAVAHPRERDQGERSFGNPIFGLPPAGASSAQPGDIFLDRGTSYAETDEEDMLAPLPACIQKTYDKAADDIPVFDPAAHENESRMRRLSREAAEREMERARNPTTLTDAEIKEIGDFYENPDNTLFR